MSLAVRSVTPPTDVASSVRAQIRALDPDQPVLACYLPARRAMRIGPIVALRHD